MWARTDDPEADFYDYDADCAKAEKRCPVCCNCGERLWGDRGFFVEGEWWCDECEDDLKDAVWENIKGDYERMITLMED